MNNINNILNILNILNIINIQNHTMLSVTYYKENQWSVDLKYYPRKCQKHTVFKTIFA